eukprot:CAMPEP_0117682734 /NCGR_PEP_ID=MMETSP0804-20121206/19882_1 /TAXON_ID=1074897 /ORGANISM="Tetraselmis astigmatica, Strain CCMP880" /LENGTH=431 /DNA_ID=CAMNT_0005492995 /DNA_START=156 /DNA_END=1453 /DNA_ORIENTATION=-
MIVAGRRLLHPPPFGLATTQNCVLLQKRLGTLQTVRASVRDVSDSSRCALAPLSQRHALTASSSGQVAIHTVVDLIAFAHPSTLSGGNPVTAFLFPAQAPPPDELTRSCLAKTCQWESVVVQPSYDILDGRVISGTMSFHVPSGTSMDMSRLRDAVLGASVLLAADSDTRDSAAIRGGQSTEFSFRIANGGLDEVHRAIVSSTLHQGAAPLLAVELSLPIASYSEASLERDSIAAMLLEHLGMRPEDMLCSSVSNPVDSVGSTPRLPLMNAGVMGRTKTMVPLRSAGRVNQATAPSDPDDSENGAVFKIPPETISTRPADHLAVGMVLTITLTRWAQRLSAGSSRGRADTLRTPAMALATALRRQGFYGKGSGFGFHQGRAMGMESWIGVRFQAQGSASAADVGRVVCEGLVTRNARWAHTRMKSIPPWSS